MQFLLLLTLKKAMETTVGKAENAGNIFSFSHSVFYSIKERNCHFSNAQFVCCKCFQNDQV